MIYTSYWARARELENMGIEPVAVSRGKPRWFRGRSIDCLAPTWQMLEMDDADFWPEYERLLSGLDPQEVVRLIGTHDVALLCWEKDSCRCHRSMVREWLQFHGHECEEFAADRQAECAQLSLF